MAWPNTPLTTYTFNGAPPIKSFDLNEIQGAINGIVNGTLTLGSVTVDGTGGVVIAGTPGHVIAPNVDTNIVTFNNNTTSYPAFGVSIKNQVLNKSIVKAWGVLNFDATTALVTFQGVGFNNPTYTTATSNITIPFLDNFTTTNYTVLCTGSSMDGANRFFVDVDPANRFTSNFVIRFYDSTYNAAALPLIATSVYFVVLGVQVG